jgi:hypothetical protein
VSVPANSVPTESQLPSRKPRRWRRVVLGFFALLFVGIIYLVFFRETEFQHVITELDRTDPGWRMEEIWNEYLTAVPPEEQNSFVVVRKSRAKLTPQTRTVLYQPDELMSLFSNETIDFRQPPAIAPAVLEQAAKTLESARESLELAHTIRKYKRGAPHTTSLATDGVGTVLPHLNDLGDVGMLVFLEGAHAALTGDPKKAIQAAITCAHLGRSIGDEPFHISQLRRQYAFYEATKLVELTLALHPTVPDELLAEFQQLLAEEYPIPKMASIMRADRANLHQLYDNLRTGKDTIRAMVTRWGLRVPSGIPVQSVLFALQERGEHTAILKYSTDLIEICKHPEQEWLSRVKAQPGPASRGSVVFKVLQGLGFGERIITAHLQSQARLRTARVAIACERYRMKTGDWPKTLAEIPKELLPAVPNDPFDGKPVKYKLGDGVAIVYSVGEDETDHGGNLSKILYPQPGSLHDIGFQLRDPNQRALPYE